MSDVREAGMEGQGRAPARRAGGEPRGALERAAEGAGGAPVAAGESLDLLARETGQSAGRIAGWREEFLATDQP